MAGVNDKIGTGETVIAVLTNAETGEKRTIEPKKKSEPVVHTQRIEVIVTDLVTGRVQRYEVTR